MLVNRLTANYEYSWGNGENLLLPTQTQLSEKLHIFKEIFIALSKFTLSFEHFEKKNEVDSSSISEVIDSKKCAYLNA